MEAGRLQRRAARDVLVDLISGYVSPKSSSPPRTPEAPESSPDDRLRRARERMKRNPRRPRR
jgi:hypothetical protein